MVCAWLEGDEVECV
uniref:Uncharacterized protein n=1 Tax=Bartonella schoenbuchensis (strain DSM 13525 / NCTC 13165 / R1) TaxID=687861 RepID=E6Z1G6_BARSR|nr:hypothetical protein BARSC_190227 [Bartonella schoenbuchensis R1]